MSGEDEIEPIDPELEALFAIERERPAPDEGRAERVLAAVLLTLGGMPDGGGGETPPPSGAPSEPGAGGAAAASTLKLAALGALLLAAGMGAGAALHAKLAEPRVEVRTVVERIVVEREVERTPAASDDASERAVPVEQVAISEAERGQEAHDGQLEASAAPRRRAASPPRPAPQARVPESPTDSDALSRESALLARAQAALGRRAPHLAIAALREHDQRFQNGQLREERDALWVSALSAAGDREAAARRAAQFRARYPYSPLLPSVEAALERP